MQGLATKRHETVLKEYEMERFWDRTNLHKFVSGCTGRDTDNILKKSGGLVPREEPRAQMMTPKVLIEVKRHAEEALLTFVETSVGYKHVKKYRANNNLVEQRKRRASVKLRIREYLTHPNDSGCEDN